jgi:hypothetical protein
MAGVFSYFHNGGVSFLDLYDYDLLPWGPRMIVHLKFALAGYLLSCCLSSIILYSCPNLMLSEDEDTIIRGLSPFNKKIIIINDKKEYHSLLESQ